MSEKIRKHYQSLYAQHGHSHHAVQHSSIQGQYRRFEILCEGIEPHESVADLGCGLGDMLKHLRTGGHRGQYLGLDLMPEFIDACRRDFSDDLKSEFQVMNLMHDPSAFSVDHAIISGTFNNKFEGLDGHSFCRTVIGNFFKICNKSIRFNMLSTFVDYEDDALYYENPLEIFRFCREEISPFLNVRHDYIFVEGGFPYEFSMFVYRHPQ